MRLSAVANNKEPGYLGNKLNPFANKDGNLTGTTVVDCDIAYSIKLSSLRLHHFQAWPAMPVTIAGVCRHKGTHSLVCLCSRQLTRNYIMKNLNNCLHMLSLRT